MLAAKNLISQISGGAIKTLIKAEVSSLASTSSPTLPNDHQMFYRASSPHQMTSSLNSSVVKIQSAKSFHTGATPEKKYDHHFVEDSYFLEE